MCPEHDHRPPDGANDPLSSDAVNQGQRRALIDNRGWQRTQLDLLIACAEEYAVFELDEQGRISTWNGGAERLFGYSNDEIVGRLLSVLYSPEDVAAGNPLQALERARSGQDTERGRWCIRKDGTHFLANSTTVALCDDKGRLHGFCRVVCDLSQRGWDERAFREERRQPGGTGVEATEGERSRDEIRRLNAELERRVAERTAELTVANEELDAFCYSVSHDLRAPLRGIDGFSQALLEDYGDRLDAEGSVYLHRVRAEAQRMGQLIDDLLELSRVTRLEILREPVDLTRAAREIIETLRRRDPDRRVTFVVDEGLSAEADERLIRIVLENLLGNSWKFTGTREAARIEFGKSESEDSGATWFVRDNGVGFNMTYADYLFGAFQRLHGESEFPGTGIGLATVQRIIHRHRGRVWADAAPDRGATFFFKLDPKSNPPDRPDRAS